MIPFSPPPVLALIFFAQGVYSGFPLLVDFHEFLLPKVWVSYARPTYHSACKAGRGVATRSVELTADVVCTAFIKCYLRCITLARLLLSLSTTVSSPSCTPPLPPPAPYGHTTAAMYKLSTHPPPDCGPQEIVETLGMSVIDCSWARLDEIPFHQVTMPNRVAATSS